MDGFNNGFTSSTSIKPNSPSQGNDIDEDELIEAMDLKLTLVDNKRPTINDFMSTTVSEASKVDVPKRNISAVRSETLDGEGQQILSRSLSFDSKYFRISVIDGHGYEDGDNSFLGDSQLQPYDPIKNYLTPRPRYLRYDPDRHNEIFVRQERVTRVRRSASFDSRMPVSEKELKSNGDCFPGSSSQEKFMEEKEEITENSVGKCEDEHEHEEEMEDEFDDYEEDNGWISNVLQCFLVMIALILTTLIISSMNSATLSPARESIWGFVDLYTKTPMMQMVGKFREVGGYEERDKKGLVVYTGELVVGLEIAETEVLETNEIDVDQDEEDYDQLEGLETAETKKLEYDEIDVDHDEESYDQLEGLETEETKELEYDEIDVDHDEESYDQLEGSETEETKELEYDEIDVDHDEENYDQLEGLEINENKEIEIKETNDPLQESLIPIRKEREKTHEIEPKTESFDQLLGDDSNRTDANEQLETVKMEDVAGKERGRYENDNEEIETIHFLIKLVSFDPIFTASVGVSVLILSSLSVRYYSKKMKASSSLETTIAHKDSTDRKIPFVNPSHSGYKMHSASVMLKPIKNEISESQDSNFSPSFIQSDAFSSTERKSSHLELSTGDSHSRGSFTIKKKIVKKQKSKTPEVVLSTVRRSSRIHSRSSMSP